MKRVLRAALAPIGLFIATTLLGIASNTHLFDALLLGYINNEKVAAVKEIINLANFIALVLPLGIQSIIRGVKANKAKVLMEKYGERQRKYLFAILSEKEYITGGSENDFNIRVFRKKGGFLVSEDINGFCGVPINRKLSFSISKNQGLCVKVYKTKYSQLELENAGKDEYHLSKQQQASAGELKFIVAIPVCGTNNDNVRCVVCFDSFQKIGNPKSADQILKTCEHIAYDIVDVIG